MRDWDVAISAETVELMAESIERGIVEVLDGLGPRLDRYLEEGESVDPAQILAGLNRQAFSASMLRHEGARERGSRRLHAAEETA